MILESDGGREWQTQLLSSAGGKVLMRIMGEHGLVVECWTRSRSTRRLGLLKQRIALGTERPMRGSQIEVAVPARPQ
jgi:hypothetical protein